MDKNYLKELLTKHSLCAIAKIVNLNASTVRYWANKYKLESRYSRFGVNNPNRIPGNSLGISPKSGLWGINSKRMSWKDKSSTLPLAEINQKFQLGSTWSQISKEYKINDGFINWLFTNKLLDPVSDEIKLNNTKLANSIGRPQSEESKHKISIARKKYLSGNGLHRWHNKSKHHTSWLCEEIKKELKMKGVIFTEEFMPLKDSGRFFSLDIAIPDRKVAFEINGRQHYDAKCNLLPYYQDRHKLIESAGWKVYEIPYDKNYSKIVNFIVDSLASHGEALT